MALNRRNFLRATLAGAAVAAGSSAFAACGGIHLEDLYIKAEYRKHGFGRYFFDAVAKRAKAEGYSRMEWSCLDWNTPSLAFYEKLGAAYDSGRKYLELPL